MLKILSLLLCCTLLAGCGANGPALKPFKMDIQQGNVVTSKMLLQLKPGMTKSQVRFIMGTPLIVDSFHKDRWDYFYQMRQSGKIVEQRRVILDFEKELLSKVRGDVVPQGAAGAAKDADVSDLNVANAPITVEPKPKEVSVLDRLKFWKKDEKALVKPEVTPALVTPAKAAPVEAAIVAVPLIVAAAVEDAKPEMAKPESASASLENIEAEKNLPAKNLSDKNLPDKASSEKNGSKTSWVDSLKFWKKNKPTAAETAALEDAKAETAAAAANQAAQASAPIADVTAPEAQSILVVPIELPTGEVAKDAVKTRENDAVEPVKTAPLRTEPFDAKTPPAITGKESMKTLKSPSQKMLPAKPEFIKPLPAKPAVPSSVFNKAPLEKPAPVDSQLSRPLKPLPLVPKKGVQLIFRMDKTLDLVRGQAVNPQASPDAKTLGVTTPEATTIDANSRPVKAESEPLPVEAAPSFFDKMLEKIGF